MVRKEMEQFHVRFCLEAIIAYTRTKTDLNLIQISKRMNEKKAEHERDFRNGLRNILEKNILELPEDAHLHLIDDFKSSLGQRTADELEQDIKVAAEEVANDLY